ncbi:16221_t:CDS:2, partial [Racocetra persica]
TQRLKLHDNYFLTRNTAIEIEIEEFFKTIFIIDPSLEQTMITLNSLNKQQFYNNFLKFHCQTRTYTFQVKKYKEYYKEFDELYGQSTSEEYRDTFLNKNDTETIIQYLENISYSCGSPLLPDEYLLSNQLYIRQDITCDLPIEQNYYSCHIKDVDLYYWFRAED